MVCTASSARSVYLRCEHLTRSCLLAVRGHAVLSIGVSFETASHIELWEFRHTFSIRDV